MSNVNGKTIFYGMMALAQAKRGGDEKEIAEIKKLLAKCIELPKGDK